ncbi:MAG: adhesin, partial [Comamonadaceae bacterium]
ARQANSVSVGDATTGLLRTISSVAPGVAGTDAVNVDQLQRAGQQILGQANDYADRGVAAAMALPAIPMLAPGERYAGAAVGSYGGKTALGVAVGFQVNRNWNLGAGVSAAQGGGKVGARVQAGLRW